MASYLQIENISKSYGPKVLFENISFNINEGDKITIVGVRSGYKGTAQVGSAFFVSKAE